ncbi:MAG TPA: hypothetical protein VFF69_04655 [Phycisphaerales bacterium]|nr:hypothetical protein [Phycisphaerales bacterium]
MRDHTLIYAVLLCAAIASGALGQEETPAEPPEPQPAASEPLAEETHTIESAQQAWTIKFEPAMWYVAPNGNVRLPGSSGAGNGETYTVGDLNLDSPRPSLFGELQLKRGDWRISVEGASFATDDRGAIADEAGQIGAVPFSAGDSLRSSLDLTTFSAAGAYAFHGFESGEMTSGGVKARSTLLAVAGIRAVDVSFDTAVLPMDSTGTPGTAGGDAMHAHPFAGVRWELEVLEDFTIDVTATLGGLPSGESESWSSDILVGFQWNPTPHIGAQIGYRQLLLGVEDGEAPTEFAWQGGLAGVYAGLTLRF